MMTKERALALRAALTKGKAKHSDGAARATAKKQAKAVAGVDAPSAEPAAVDAPVLRPKRPKGAAVVVPPSRPVASAMELVPDDPVEDTKVGKNQLFDGSGKPVNAGSVRRWFEAGIGRLYGREFKVGRWSAKQFTLARRLLDEFGPDLTKKAVDYFCDHWDEIVRDSRGKLRGNPSIALLWGMKDSIFGEVQKPVDRRGGRRKHKDEYKPETDAPDTGW